MAPAIVTSRSAANEASVVVARPAIVARRRLDRAPVVVASRSVANVASVITTRSRTNVVAVPAVDAAVITIPDDAAAAAALLVTPVIASATITSATITPPVCVICLTNPAAAYVLVPCGHAQFCPTCLCTLGFLNAAGIPRSMMHKRCPSCRASITIAMRYFN